MGADRSQWQFPKNEADKLLGWRSNGKGLENKSPGSGGLGDMIRSTYDAANKAEQVLTVGDASDDPDLSINPDKLALRGNVQAALDAKDTFPLPVKILVDGATNAPQLFYQNLNYAPSTASFGDVEVGKGIGYFQVNQTGGYGSYGSFLIDYNSDFEQATGYSVHVLSAWHNSSNMTGGRTNCFWPAANSPASNISGHAWTDGYVTTAELNIGNRWADFGVQTQYGSGISTAGLLIAPDVAPSKDGLNYWDVASADTGTDTFTVTGHNFTDWMGIEFYAASFGGTLPTGITEGTAYYVRDSATNTFKVASTLNGTAIDLTGAMSGTVKCVPRYPTTFGVVFSRSVHRNAIGTAINLAQNSLQPNGHFMYLWGSDNATVKPASAMTLRGNFIRAFDFSNVSFTGNQAIYLAAAHKILWGTAATIGGPASGTGVTLATSGTSDVGHIASPQGDAITWATSGSATKLGFFGATAIVQPFAVGETDGFTANSGTAVNDASTFTGNVGSRQYRINDIVKALKNIGLLSQ